MESLYKRRISDISFVIDADLTVQEGNNTSLKFFLKTDFSGIKLDSIFNDFDKTNFKSFIKNFPDDGNPHNFIANIQHRNRKIDCIFSVEKLDSNAFKVSFEELSYSRDLFDKAILERREFTALLQNFDAYYFIYSNEIFILKNTNDLITIFEGPKDAFKEFLAVTFKINLEHKETKSQLESMFSDIEKFESSKYYTLIQTDKKKLTIHTQKSSTRKMSSIIGSIKMTKSHAPTENVYAESKDGLTGLYNKKAITEIAVKKINEEKSPCSLIIIDADNFKECNDTYGHSFGDRVLVTIANCIRDAVNGKGVAGRIGGDEFLILLNHTEKEEIRSITKQIRSGIQWGITNVEKGCIVTCSMGIARFPDNAKNYEQLFDTADKSLYIAKYRGRNCYIIYTPELHDKIIIENKERENTVASGKYFADNVSSEIEILEAINKLNKKDSESTIKILNNTKEYLGVNKITVYDKNLKKLFIVGDDDIDIRSDFFSDEYFSFVNAYGFLHLDNTNVLNSVDAKRYSIYRTHNIASLIEVLCKDSKNKRNLFVCYDIYRPARSFSKEKITFALLVANLLAKIL